MKDLILAVLYSFVLFGAVGLVLLFLIKLLPENVNTKEYCFIKMTDQTTIGDHKCATSYASPFLFCEDRTYKDFISFSCTK